MGEMRALSKRYQMAGVQNIPIRVETLGCEIGLQKSPKPEDYLRIKIVFWLIKPIHEIRSKLINTPLHPFLVKKSVYYCYESHTKVFEELKIQTVNIKENDHFDIKRMSRLKTDASHSSLGATLEQWMEKIG